MSVSHKKKSVAIVGCGFVGMAVAWVLSKNGYEVSVYESTDAPGGLASGFKDKKWGWSLEKHYHHVFETDKEIKSIITEMGLESEIFFLDTKSMVQYEGNRYQLDSPTSLLKFNPIGFFSRIRTGAVLAFCKLFPFGIWLERITAKDFLKFLMGNESWRVIWEPLFLGKFGDFAGKINASWFWARIFSRSKKLGYFNGGFLSLAEKMVERLEKKGVIFYFNCVVEKIEKNNDTFYLISKKIDEKSKKNVFDKVVVTTPSNVFSKIYSDLPNRYLRSILDLKGLGAITMILELNKPFFADKTYWLNINEKKWPFLAVVEHTNFISSNNYGDKSLLYVGKYLDKNTKQFKMNPDELYDLYLPYLQQLSPDLSNSVSRKWLFKETFAQPIVEKNHSKKLPSLETPVENLYWASMQHVYPWDRGTNFAVKIGMEVSKILIENDKKE